MEYERIVQPFEPVYDGHSRVLVLGSLPSGKSRENGFYYGHPQNRFWKVIAGIYGKELPQTVEEKKNLLHECGIALWDVIESCDIKGASDSSIRNVKAAGVGKVLAAAPIERIFANGRAAEKLYNQYVKESAGVGIEGLPSTSPANAAYSLERLLERWKAIRQQPG